MTAGPPPPPLQTYFAFLKKFIPWAYRDLRRHYRPLEYTNAKGPQYMRPIGYDERPLLVKARDPYVHTRVLYHLRCGWMTYLYRKRVQLHALFPKYVDNVQGPLSSYYPPTPQRFPPEFIRAERARMKKFDLPPNTKYEEFRRDPPPKVEVEEDNSPSLFGMGKSLRDRILGEAKQRASRVDVGALRDRAQSQASSVITQERKDAFKGAVDVSQALANRAMGGDLKGAAAEAKEIWQRNLKANEALKDSAKEQATAFQAVIGEFLKGYLEGKKYEEAAQTDPRELLQSFQDQAKKAAFFVASETPNLVKGEGDLKQRLQAFAEKGKRLDEFKLSPEEEARMKKEAEAWLREKGAQAREMAGSTAEHLAQTREVKAALAAKDRATAKAQEAKDRAQQTIEKESANVQKKLGEASQELRSRIENEVKKQLESDPKQNT